MDAPPHRKRPESSRTRAQTSDDAKEMKKSAGNGIAYEYIDEDLANKSDALLRYNPVTKKVPVLVNDGELIAESAIIVEYIDEVWKDGYAIMPFDPYERAQARFWAKYADEKCNAAIYPVFTETGEAQTKVVHEAQQYLKTLEKAVEGKKFFGGDAFGYLDVVVGWYAHWLPIIEEVSGASVVTEEELPLMKAWFDRNARRRRGEGDPALEAPKDKILALNKARREHLLSA
ncbi:hypothetical protein ACQ4PT_024037 [Festuca glaucescens]